MAENDIIIRKITDKILQMALHGNYERLANAANAVKRWRRES